MCECFNNCWDSIDRVHKLLSITIVYNGESASKVLSIDVISRYVQGSTTIPEKGVEAKW